jgi:hypothetical protein
MNKVLVNINAEHTVAFIKRFLDFVHTVFICHSAYYFLVTQYGNPGALVLGEWWDFNPFRDRLRELTIILFTLGVFLCVFLLH